MSSVCFTDRATEVLEGNADFPGKRCVAAATDAPGVDAFVSAQRLAVMRCAKLLAAVTNGRTNKPIK